MPESVLPPLKVSSSGSTSFMPVFELEVSGGNLIKLGPSKLKLEIPVSGATGASTAANYVTFAADAGLSNEKVLTASSGIALTTDNTTILMSIDANTRLRTAGFFAGGNLSTTHLAEESRIRIPFTLTGVRVDLSVTSSAAGAAIIVDLNQYNALLGAGTSMFAAQADQPQIPAGFLAGSALVFTAISTLYAGSFLGFDLDQVGSTTVGSNLTITIVARST